MNAYVVLFFSPKEFIDFLILGLEPKSSYMPGNYSATKLCPAPYMKSLKKNTCFYFTHVHVCLHVCNMHMWCEEDKKECLTPGTGVTDSYELSCQSWEPNPGPIQEQFS